MNLILPVKVNTIKNLDSPELKIELGILPVDNQNIIVDLNLRYALSTITLFAINYNNVEIKQLYIRQDNFLKIESFTYIIKSHNNEPFIVVNNYFPVIIENNQIKVVADTIYKIDIYAYNINIDSLNKNIIITSENK